MQGIYAEGKGKSDKLEELAHSSFWRRSESIM